MPLFQTKHVDEGDLRRLVKEHWSLELGACLKASQNHTFAATRGDADAAEKFVVRATPDPDTLRESSVEVEVGLLDFLHANALEVSRSVRTLSSPAQSWIRSGDCIVAVFERASGEPVVFTDWLWLTERARVVGLGRWFARLHTLTMRFVTEHPQLLSQVRRWTELHDGILADVALDARDVEASSDPTRFGLIHGDVNVSNFYHCEASASPHMFDWDQAQIAWFMYDLSAPVWTVITVQCGGNPIDNTPVPQANVKQYKDWLVEGYEAGRMIPDERQREGAGRPASVDRDALQRMIGLRRTLYRRFCIRAIAELPPDSPMAKFCTFMNSWLDKEPE